MSGLYLPPSYRDEHNKKKAALDAANARMAAPDITEAMELQKRLQARDPRLELFWGTNPGPHFRRWVVCRNGEDGQQSVVKVFQNSQMEYERPDPSLAERLMDVTGRSGDDFLKDVERAEAASRAADEKQLDEWSREVGERIASDVKRASGDTSSIVVPGGYK